MRILLASRNQGKLREFSGLLPGFNLIPWPHEAPEIPEEGAFFRDNALQKAAFARDWWREHGRESVDAVLADDSGLCVDALWGGPGVLSARFGRGLDSDAKNRRLLALLPPQAPRNARFICVLAHARRDAEPLCAEGVVEGTLSREPLGQHGFGYDPIFIPEGFEQTFGELPVEVKQRLSHRGRACEALLRTLGARFSP